MFFSFFRFFGARTLFSSFSARGGGGAADALRLKHLKSSRGRKKVGVPEKCGARGQVGRQPGTRCRNGWVGKPLPPGGRGDEEAAQGRGEPPFCESLPLSLALSLSKKKWSSGLRFVWGGRESGGGASGHRRAAGEGVGGSGGGREKKRGLVWGVAAQKKRNRRAISLAGGNAGERGRGDA